MRRDHSRFVRDRTCPHAQLPKGHQDMIPAKRWANEAVNPNGDHWPGVQAQLAVYLERFAFFFQREFFVKKAFEKLNSEEKPEHAGFRKACDTLYAVYRQEQLIGTAEAEAGSLLEHVYDDAYALDVARVDRFFVWLGVLKPAPSTHLRSRRSASAAQARLAAESKRDAPLEPMPADASDRVAEGGESVAEMTQIAAELTQIAAELQKATLRRDIPAVRWLMARRNELQQRLRDRDEEQRAPAASGGSQGAKGRRRWW